MPITRFSRTAPMVAMACAFLLIAMSVSAASAGARPAAEPFRTSYQPAPQAILAGDQPPYTATGATAATAIRPVAAPQASYYASFAQAKPTSSVATTGSPDDTPWLAIILVAGGSMLFLAAAGGLTRRHTRHGHVHVPA
ncbi:MAG: hypothetical protein QOE86_1170 [Solirubrobacteraceae bacterium]|nr:hypothetical protein [Solirubrobacteraceae bacterium]